MTGSAARNLEEMSAITLKNLHGEDSRLQPGGESAVGHDLEQHFSAQQEVDCISLHPRIHGTQCERT